MKTSTPTTESITNDTSYNYNIINDDSNDDHGN